MKKCASGIALLLLGFLWLCFLCNHVMSRYGIYEVFSYSVNEFLSLVPLLGPVLTSVWAAVLLVRGLRQKAWKPVAPLLAVLLLFSALQFTWLYRLCQTASAVVHVTIDSIDPKTLTLRAQTSDGAPLTLRYPMLIENLLKTDGTAYYISYEANRSSPSQGTLMMVWDTLEPDVSAPDVSEPPSGAASSQEDPLPPLTEADKAAAYDAACDYYLGTVFDVHELTEIDVRAGEITFRVNCSKGGVRADPDRTISLERKNGAWAVVSEGY